MRLDFDDLTPEEQGYISNGCGPKVGGWAVPEFVFSKSCGQHDLEYWIGGGWRDRRRADWDFLQDMRSDAGVSSWWKRPFLRAMAWTYYLAVRAGGRSAFHFGRVRTRLDLYREMQDASQVDPTS